MLGVQLPAADVGAGGTGSVVAGNVEQTCGVDTSKSSRLIDGRAEYFWRQRACFVRDRRFLSNLLHQSPVESCEKCTDTASPRSQPKKTGPFADVQGVNEWVHHEGTTKSDAEQNDNYDTDLLHRRQLVPSTSIYLTERVLR